MYEDRADQDKGLKQLNLTLSSLKLNGVRAAELEIWNEWLESWKF